MTLFCVLQALDVSQDFIFALTHFLHMYYNPYMKILGKDFIFVSLLQIYAKVKSLPIEGVLQ